MIDGESENPGMGRSIFYELLREIDAGPAFVGGSSSGCRLALLLALQHPEAVRGLLLWRVTGGAHAAEHLTNQYYTSHIEAARQGGMEAVCRLDHWSEVIGINKRARDVLTALNPDDFIGRMTWWRRSFQAGAERRGDRPLPAELRSMTMPACIAPGMDPVHPLAAGQAAHRLMPNAEYQEVVTEQHGTLDEAFADWEAREGLLAARFIDFLRRTGAVADGRRPYQALRLPAGLCGLRPTVVGIAGPGNRRRDLHQPPRDEAREVRRPPIAKRKSGLLL